jgi:hypothetical protein
MNKEKRKFKKRLWFLPAPLLYIKGGYADGE